MNISKPKNGSMIGKFFHSYTDANQKTMCWQGRILSRPSAGVYLVQLYEFIMGQESDQVLISFADMLNWRFYDTVNDWHFAYDQYSRAQRVAERMAQ